MARRPAIALVVGVVLSMVVATATAAAPPVPAAVKLLDVKFDKGHGTATVLAKVPGPGTLTLTGRKVLRRSVEASGVGIAKLKVATKGGALKTLIRSGRVKVRVTVKFLATEGARTSATRAIVLHRTKHPRGAG